MKNYQVQYSIGDGWEWTGGYSTAEAAQKVSDEINNGWDGDVDDPHFAEVIEEEVIDEEPKEYTNIESAMIIADRMDGV